jgi:hypothetical protein
LRVKLFNRILKISVAEPHNFYAAPTPAPGKYFDAAPAPATPAPTLLYSKTTFLNLTVVNTYVEKYLVHMILYDLPYIDENMN